MAARTGNAIAVQGLAELQRALRRAEGEAPKYLRRGLTEIAKGVKRDATANITHRTGRHGNEGPIRVRTSVTARGASVYANEVHAIVQDVGGQVGRSRATLLRRDSVSQFMTKAVRNSRPRIEREMEQLLDTLGRDFER